MTTLQGFYPSSGAWKSFRDGKLQGESVSGRVLLITSDGTLSAGNTALLGILSNNGNAVIARSWADLEDYTDVDVVVLTEGLTSTDNGKFLFPPVGVVSLDCWRTIGMASSIGYLNSINEAEVVDTASPLAAGVTGTFAPYATPQYITWTTDFSANPDVVVTRPSAPTQAVVFGYEAGSNMTGRFATTRHVALGYHQNGFAAGLSASAEAQVLAAVAWARASAYVAPPAPAAPIGLAASPGDTTVSLSWTASVGADTYSVKRSSTAGGPYTAIQTGLTSTSFTDTGRTNGTPYYYVVSATNVQGESANSVEVTATPTTVAHAGLHVTQGELDLWRSRVAAGGPYVTANTEWSGSPDEWNEIVGRRGTFYSNHLGQVYNLPNPANGTFYVEGEEIGQSTFRSIARNVGSAAFWAMVMHTHADRQTTLDRVAANLDLWTRQSNLDFWNRTKWKEPFLNQDGPSFSMNHAIISLIYAYDYWRIATGSTIPAFEHWLLGWADFEMIGINGHMGHAFNNPFLSSWSLKSGQDTSEMTWDLGPYMWHNSPTLKHVHAKFNNRRCSRYRVVGLIGLTCGNTTHANNMAWLWKRAVEYALWSNGGLMDMQRGNSSIVDAGLSYATLIFTHFFAFADAYTRKPGNEDLLAYSTTAGGGGSQGTTDYDTGQKNFTYWARTFARYGNNTYARYKVGSPGDESARHNFRNSNRGNQGRLVLGYPYHKNTLVRSLFTGDTAAGMPSLNLDAVAASDRNDSGTYPGAHFMFDQATVDPYPGSS